MGSDIQDLSKLIANYVRQLLVSEPGTDSDPRILLRLDEAVLPETELTLTKTPNGWVLAANTRSQESERLVTSNRQALVKRFAQNRLGDLTVAVTFVP
jgi:hypothetical protein